MVSFFPLAHAHSSRPPPHPRRPQAELDQLAQQAVDSKQTAAKRREEEAAAAKAAAAASKAKDKAGKAAKAAKAPVIKAL